jgi:hypothetical protein
MPTIPPLVESAIHEASHATLIILVLRRKLEYVEVDERGSGLTRAVPQDKPPPLPKPWEQRAIDIKRRLNHAEVVGAIRRSAVGAKALGIEEDRRERPLPAYRAVTFARGSVLETESGHLLAIRSDGRAHHFRSLGEAYGWL